MFIMVTDRLCGAAIAGTPSTAGVTWAMVDCWPKASVEPPIKVRKSAPTAAAPRLPKNLINVFPVYLAVFRFAAMVNRVTITAAAG